MEQPSTAGEAPDEQSQLNPQKERKTLKAVSTTPHRFDSFDWARLVVLALHPLEVQIIEAMLWVERPLTSDDLARLFDEAVPRHALIHRLRRLASCGVIELVVPQTAKGLAKAKYRLRPR